MHQCCHRGAELAVRGPGGGVYLRRPPLGGTSPVPRRDHSGRGVVPSRGPSSQRGSGNSRLPQAAPVRLWSWASRLATGGAGWRAT
eukprot:6502730-Lingulodinium_polyedra.AAC.1